MSRSEAVESPETVVRAYFAALAAGRFAEAAGYLEPASISEFRQYQLELARAVAERSAAVSEPDEPGSATQFSSTQQPIPCEASFMFTFPLVRQFAGIETLDQLQQLGPSEMLLCFLQARTPEHQRQQTLREGRNPGPGASRPSIERQVLGAVREGEALAHVVFRSTSAFLRDEFPPCLDVVTLRRSDAGWRIVFRVEPPEINPLSYFVATEGDGTSEGY